MDISLLEGLVREVGLEPTDPYGSGYLIRMTPYLHTILSPPPLTSLGYSRVLWSTPQELTARLWTIKLALQCFGD